MCHIAYVNYGQAATAVGDIYEVVEDGCRRRAAWSVECGQQCGCLGGGDVEHVEARCAGGQVEQVADGAGLGHGLHCLAGHGEAGDQGRCDGGHCVERPQAAAVVAWVGDVDMAALRSHAVDTAAEREADIDRGGQRGDGGQVAAGPVGDIGSCGGHGERLGEG